MSSAYQSLSEPLIDAPAREPCLQRFSRHWLAIQWALYAALWTIWIPIQIDMAAAFGVAADRNKLRFYMIAAPNFLACAMQTAVVLAFVIMKRPVAGLGAIRKVLLCTSALALLLMLLSQLLTEVNVFSVSAGYALWVAQRVLVTAGNGALDPMIHTQYNPRDYGLVELCGSLGKSVLSRVEAGQLASGSWCLAHVISAGLLFLAACPQLHASTDVTADTGAHTTKPRLALKVRSVWQRVLRYRKPLMPPPPPFLHQATIAFETLRSLEARKTAVRRLLYLQTLVGSCVQVAIDLFLVQSVLLRSDLPAGFAKSALPSSVHMAAAVAAQLGSTILKNSKLWGASIVPKYWWPVVFGVLPQLACIGITLEFLTYEEAAPSAHWWANGAAWRWLLVQGAIGVVNSLADPNTKGLLAANRPWSMNASGAITAASASTALFTLQVVKSTAWLVLPLLETALFATDPRGLPHLLLGAGGLWMLLNASIVPLMMSNARSLAFCRSKANTGCLPEVSEAP